MTAKKINLVAVNMGYGHQRAAYPLRHLAGGEIITLNDYDGISRSEKNFWEKSERSYNRLSRFKHVPLLGNLVFGLMDAFQKIPPYYPWRDLSAPTVQQKYFYQAIKKGLGKALVEELNKSGLPWLTTFFVAAYVAEYHNYQGEIYCLVCDSDASRAWVPFSPRESRIKYLLPTERLKKRFLMYGLREENLFVSGFPLPLENIGARREILLADLSRRLNALDPQGIFRARYKDLLAALLPAALKKDKSAVTITFAVGGAGAQTEIGAGLLKVLEAALKAREFNLNLVAGSRPEVRDYFITEIKKNGLSNAANVKIIFAPNKLDYFKKFNQILRATDILWTKPSELSFYCALGLPFIISSPLGSQEDFNRDWLLSLDTGLDSLPLEYTAEWLPDLLVSGRLARLALNGFLNAPLEGTSKIETLFKKSL